MRLIGQPHFNLSFFLLQRKSIYDRILQDNRRHSFYFFLTSEFLFSLAALFGLNFGQELKRFFLFGHRRPIERLDHTIFHHERLDLVFEVGLPDIHQRVHLLNSSLK